MCTIQLRDSRGVTPKLVGELTEDVVSVLRIALETEEIIIRSPALELPAKEHQVCGPGDGILPAEGHCLARRIKAETEPTGIRNVFLLKLTAGHTKFDCLV